MSDRYSDYSSGLDEGDSGITEDDSPLEDDDRGAVTCVLTDTPTLARLTPHALM